MISKLSVSVVRSGTFISLLCGSAILFMPVALFADSPGHDEAVAFVKIVNEVFIYPLIALLASVALLVFVWGAFEYVMNAESPVGRETGRNHMMYGVIGLLVMVSALTILQIATNSFGLLGMLNWAMG